MLGIYPERVNGLTKEVCTKRVRMYTIRMVRVAKLIFVGGLLVTSICDAMGKRASGVLYGGGARADGCDGIIL